MIRGVVEQALRDHAWWIVGPVAGLFAATVAPTSELFSDMAAETSGATWQSLSGIFGIGAVLLFIGVSLITAATIVGALSWLVEIPLRELFGLRMTTFLRYVIGSGVVMAAWALVPSFDPLATGTRLKDDVHVLSQILGGNISMDVSLEQLLWGVTNDPLLEFTGLVVIVIITGTVVVHRYFGIPTLWVLTSSVIVSLGLVSLSAASGTEVFPLQARWGFLFVATVLWGVLLSVITGVDRFIYELEASTPMIQEGHTPRIRYAAFDSLMLCILFGVMGSPLSGLLGWVFWRIWRTGGWQNLLDKYNSPNEGTTTPAPEPQEVTINEQD